MVHTMITTHGGTTRLSEHSTEPFRGELRGACLAPADTGFMEVRRIWNGMIDKSSALVGLLTGTADVDFAREPDLFLSVKGGGTISRERRSPTTV